MSEKDKTEKPKDDGCLSAFKSLVLIVLGSILGNFLVIQCREPEWSDYLDHVESQENRRPGEVKK